MKTERVEDFSLVEMTISDRDYQNLPSNTQNLVRMYADQSKSKNGVWHCNVPIYAVEVILKNQKS